MKARQFEHKEFAIKLSPRGKKHYQAQVLDSPVGFPEGKFEPPFSPKKTQKRLKHLDQLLSTALSPEQGEDSEAARLELLEEQEEVGKRLFRSLFSEEVGEAFEKTQFIVNGLEKEGRADGLRLLLVLDSERPEMVHVASLPWEMLLSDSGRQRLGSGRKRSILRYLANPHRNIDIEFKGPLRVLFVGTEHSREGSNKRELESLRKSFEGREDVHIDFLMFPTLEEVVKTLREGSFHVLHFYGHGRFDQEGGYLTFGDSEAKEQDVPGWRIGDYLGDLCDLRLVVLCSCEGGALRRCGGMHPFAGVAAALVEKGIPGVVAMQFPISFEAAAQFSSSFYRSLAEGLPVDVAASQGREELLGADGTSPEWATPTVFTSISDGRVLKWKRESIERDQFSSPTWRLGIRSFGPGKGIWGKDMEETCDEVLDLSEYFDGRSIRHGEFWQKSVLPKLAKVLYSQVGKGRLLRLDFAAHSSIALAAGYFLEAKSGVKIEVGQRGMGGEVRWMPQEGEAPPGPLWDIQEDLYRDHRSADTALAVGVTTDVLKDVKVFLERSELPVRRILSAHILPDTGSTSVVSGYHAMRLAEKLAKLIRGRELEECEGVLHLFVSAPNAFVFHLGQLGRWFGQVQMYEYDFGGVKKGLYSPSIRLPFLGRGS